MKQREIPSVPALAKLLVPAPHVDPEGAGEQGRLLGVIAKLERQVDDLQNELLTSNEHGDLLQEHLYRLSRSLTSEVRERQAAEEKLQNLVEAIQREKGDLEILIQILVEQGDAAAAEGEQARIDGLTRIANRRRFDECLADEWKRHYRLDMPLSLILCDVDHFKKYNDYFGHQAGDQCLKSVATALFQGFRSCDLVARYGGEEFAVVLPHTRRESAVQVAERARSAVAAQALPHPGSPVSPQVTLSIGIGSKIPHSPDPNAGMSELLEEADRNLYRSKQDGRNRISF